MNLWNYFNKLSWYKIVNKLNWKIYIGDIAIKIIVANAVHYKVRDYINNGILKSMYHTQFEPHVHYAYITWEQNASFPKENIKIDSF